MEEAVRKSLQDAGVEEYEQAFLKNLELKRLSNLDELDPSDLDQVGMGKLPRKCFEKALEKWKQLDPEAKRPAARRPNKDR